MRPPVAAPARPAALDRSLVDIALRPARLLVDVVPVGVLGRPDAPAQYLAAGLERGAAHVPGACIQVQAVEVEAPYRGAAIAAGRLLDAGVRVLVADLPAAVVRRLVPICRQWGAALVVVGAGSTEPDPLAGVVHVTEQRGRTAEVLGAWAARYLDGNLFQVVAAPDAEFEVVESLRHGYQAAGGTVVGHATTHDGATDSGAVDAAYAARLAGARTVVVHAAGDRAVEIVRAIRATGRDLEIVVDGPGSDDRTLAALGLRFGAVYSASAGTSDTLAHDAGRVIAAGARLLAQQSRPWLELADVLAGATLEGDRVLHVDAHTRSVRTPLVVRRAGAGRLSVVARCQARCQASSD
jgi:hypothetical protein